MIEAPRLAESPAQRMAYIPVTIPREKIQDVMGPGIQEVMSALAAQGIAPAGPWFTHHLRLDDDVFDFEICVPVSTAVTPTGRVCDGELAAASVVQTVFHGDYEELGDAWGEFLEWIEANGHECRADFWERYVVGPETSEDPADWRTELNRPLVARPDRS